jgi:membrane-associated protein
VCSPSGRSSAASSGGAGITLLGYLLGGIPVIQKYLDVFILLGVASVLIPLIIKIVRLRLAARKHDGTVDEGDDSPA